MTNRCRKCHVELDARFTTVCELIMMLISATASLEAFHAAHNEVGGRVYYAAVGWDILHTVV